jgi:NAD(P)-dependent dehydrogenase (short-subunit alcohol dehydrogenase family)
VTPAGELEGRVALVTGAGSGIGAAVARRIAAEGAAVVAADVHPERTAELAADVGSAVTSVAADVSEEEDVRRAVETAEGLGDLEILVNVAGIGSTTAAPETPLEVWERVMAVNARGTFLCCKHAIPPMAARGRGAIVNVASVAGLVGLRNRAAYCASKGAVIALTRALALDHVGSGIRVNAVCPGTVDTPWVRRLVEEAGESLDDLRERQLMRRLGTPDEVAEAVLYLAGERSSFVTGTAFVIDGGLSAA